MQNPVGGYCNQHFFRNHLRIDNVYTTFFSHMEKGFSSGGESHDFHELVYVDHGSIMAEVGPEGGPFEILELQQGTAYLHAPNQFHRHFVQGPMRGALGIISFQCDNPLLQQLEEKPMVLNKRQKEYLATAMNCATHLFKAAWSGNKNLIFFRAEHYNPLVEQVLQNNVELIFLDLLCGEDIRSQENEIWKDQATEDVVEAVRAYLKQHLYGKVNIEAMCQHFAYSKTTLSGKFKEATGSSIIEYFNRLKIEEAIKLMQNSSETITGIAERLHFSSCQYFSKVFKQVVGVYPREFKKSISNNETARYLHQLSTHNEVIPGYAQDAGQ